MGTINGKWMIARVFVTPVCGGMRVRGLSNEKKALGDLPGICADGSAAKAAAVFGQRSSTGKFGLPYSHKKQAPQSSE